MSSSPAIERLPDNCGIVVLCGGGSTRMGIDKSELLIDNSTTFLQKIVQQATKLADQIVIAVGSGQLVRYKQRYGDCQTLQQAIWIEDHVSNQGPMEGIHQGLKTLAEKFPDCEYAFVTSCDVPELNGNLIMALLNKIGDHDAVTPVDGKRIYGMTAVYKTHVWQNAKRNVAQQQLRVSALATSINATTVDVGELTAYDARLNAFENINTPDDYFGFLTKNDIPCTPEMKQQFAPRPQQ
ncbi:molybdenum cofactor guanylyltransferase [bacterium]|nr:molybdenum cofactor guanylyltransferase [bacterium]